VSVLTVGVVLAAGGCDGGTPTPSTTPSLVAQQASTPPATTSPSLSPTVKVEFAGLTDGTAVGYPVAVRGTVTGLPGGRQLWAVVRPHEDPKFHPQGPALVIGSGQWSATCYIGQSKDTDIGKGFSLIMVLADENADVKLGDYLTSAQGLRYPGLVTLPAGATPLAQIEVVRK
jgi:hypothetical protein